jgi:ribosomal protein S17E
MLPRSLCLAVVCVLLSSAGVLAQSADKEKEAVAGAEKWLVLIDEGKYAESWRAAAGYFTNAVTQQQWEQSLQGVRKPLGKVLSRKVANARYRTSLPGAPDGEYVVIEFETSFENKKTAVETVTPMLEREGKWRVSGYYVR